MTFVAEKLETFGQPEICAVLNTALAETAVSTMMAQNFHWNVTGMNFSSLHQQFQEIYEDHFAGQDDLAERIKALSGHADGNLTRMLERSSIEEPQGKATPTDMIAALLTAEETLASTLKSSGTFAANHGDTLTEDLCIARGQAHEKFAWILRAHLR
ncbi:MAG: Dps family protein [Shimia sp.]|uniref:Dps family protein n=1 Tax=Shimia sp. TaxID=1954381 RepID=UPI004058879E